MQKLRSVKNKSSRLYLSVSLNLFLSYVHYCSRGIREIRLTQYACAMYLHWFTGVLLMGVFLTFPSSLDGSSVCEVRSSDQQRVSMQATRTLRVATYYRCWLLFKCTTYRTAIGYKVTYQLVTRYFTTHVCCEGYQWDSTTRQCLALSGPDETMPTTENPSLNRSSESDQPDVQPSRNETSWVGVPKTTTVSISRSPPSSTTTHRTETAKGKNVRLDMSPPRTRRQAIIMISLLLFFFIAIVFSVVLGCVVYRRRRTRRIQRKVDSLHMEPLRDLQPLSEKTSHIQHFSPSFAPNDEYAIVDKSSKAPTPTEEPLRTYENTCIGGKPLAQESNCEDIKQKEENRLTHTYMDGFACVETKEMNIFPVTMETVPDNCYNEVDEMPTSKFNPDECYTEVDGMASSSAGVDGDMQDHKYYYTKFETSSPSPNECYAEVDEMPPSSVRPEGAMQEEYEAVGDVQPAYDHLDRSSAMGNPDPENSSKEVCDTEVARYGVLVQQSNSVESPESYDAFQRSISQTDQSGIDGYEPLLAVPSPGTKTDQVVDADAYDDLDRALPKTQKNMKKGKHLLEKLRQSTNATAYGHLGSSFESDTSDTGIPDMEHIYSNQDVVSGGDGESTYTDMSGSRPNSVLQRDVSLSSEKVPVETYTEMSPTHFSNNYCNVDLENSHLIMD